MKFIRNFIKKIFEIPKPKIRPKTEYPFIYPKNPKYNGNYCSNHDDGLNIYDYLDDTGEIDWKALKEDRQKIEEYKFQVWCRDYSEN